MKYGILASTTNTGVDSEVLCEFVTPTSIISNQPSYAQDMINLSRKASSQRVQRWEIETKLYPSNDNADFLSHVLTNGHSSVFPVRMPQLYGIAATTGHTLTANVSAGSDVIPVNAVAFNKGEFVQFSNDTKVYMVTEYSVNNVTIKPPLKKSISSYGTTSIITGPQVTMSAMYDTSTVIGQTYIDGILSDPGTVKLIEAI